MIWRRLGKLILKTAGEQGQNNTTICQECPLAKKVDEIDQTVRQLKVNEEKKMTVDQPKMNIFDPRFCSTGSGKKINNNIRKRSGIPRSTTFPQSYQNNDVDTADFQSEFEFPRFPPEIPRDAADA